MLIAGSVKRKSTDDTVKCHSNAIHFLFFMLLHAALIRVAESESVLESQQTPHILPSRVSWGGGVCCENFKENWPHYNGTAL